MKKQELPDEPEEGPDTAEIKFREPSSGSSFTRRFMKTDKVQLLYDYVQSKLDELEFEDEENLEFELVQMAPRKTLTDSERTLEEEGLYPRAALVIKD